MTERSSGWTSARRRGACRSCSTSRGAGAGERRGGREAKAWSPEQNGEWRRLLEVARLSSFDSLLAPMRIGSRTSRLRPTGRTGSPSGRIGGTRRRGAVYETHQETFPRRARLRADPTTNGQQWSYREPFDPELWFVATDGDELAGILLGRGERGGDFDSRLGEHPRRARTVERARPREGALLQHAFREFQRAARRAPGLASTERNEERCAVRPRRDERSSGHSCGTRSPVMSRLRAKCPDCKNADRGRARTGVRVPRLRAHVRCRHGASAARVGRRRRGDGRVGLAAASVSGSRSHRGGVARRAVALACARSSGPPARSRRRLLLAHRRGRRA